MLLGSIPVTACVAAPFPFMTDYYSFVWMYRTLFIHLSARRHLDYFHVLAFMSNTAVDVHVHAFV